MRLILLALVLSLTAYGSSSRAEGADWLGIRADLERMSQVLAAAEPPAAPVQHPLSTHPELRAFCGMSEGAFILQMISQDCGEGGCAARAKAVGQAIDIWLAQHEESMASARADGQLLFTPAGSDFPRTPSSDGEEITYRAAADLWLRNKMLVGDDTEGRDRILVGMRAWCGLISRNTAAATAFTRHHGFPSDASREGRRQVAALVYIGQHAAMDYGSLAVIRQEAEKTFRRGELSPYYMAQILDVEREAFDQQQVIGHLTSCEGSKALFDPPIADVVLAENWRAANGLPSIKDALENASRRCQ